jgi:hypothetical protein
MRARSYLQRLATPAPAAAQLFVVPQVRREAGESFEPSYAELAAHLRRLTEQQPAQWQAAPQPSQHAALVGDRPRVDAPATPASRTEPKPETPHARQRREPSFPISPHSFPISPHSFPISPHSFPVSPHDPLIHPPERMPGMHAATPGAAAEGPHTPGQPVPGSTKATTGTTATAEPPPQDVPAARPVEVRIGTIEVHTRQRPEPAPGTAVPPSTPSASGKKAPSTPPPRGYGSHFGLAQR